jgi:bacterioferritin
MGTEGRQIVDLDIDELIEKLRVALTGEFCAWYQYYLGSKLVKGPMKGEVVSELASHADEELGHAKQLTYRIIQLGGEITIPPSEWEKLSPCPFDNPTDPYTAKLLDQNIAGEQCAIKFYNELLAFVKDKDEVTFQIILDILTMEEEHEEDLQRLREDLDLMVKRGAE